MFKVGDEVFINKHEYDITTKGSIGKIIKTNAIDSLVHFTYIASNMYGENDNGQPEDHYFISNIHLTILKAADPQLAVIAKIKEMEARRIKMRKAKVKSNDVPIAPYF